MLGLFALTPLGVQGGSAADGQSRASRPELLFALVGMLYERYHTRQIADLGGLARRLPIMAFFMLLFTLSSIGLPGLNGFAGEILILIGVFQRGWAENVGAISSSVRWAAVLAVFGVVLGAWYMLWLVQRVFFGPLREPKHDPGEPVADLSLREVECAGTTGRPGVLDWCLSQVLSRSDGTRAPNLDDGGGAGIAGGRRGACCCPESVPHSVADAGFARHGALSSCLAKRWAQSERQSVSDFESPK